MRNFLLPTLILSALLSSSEGMARGGFSSSGGRSGGFSSSRSSSSPSRSFSSPRTTITRSTTINRSYGGGYYGGYGYHYHPMMMYPGFGMGYGYSNGLVEGLIIGNLMHPQGTTVYSGGGYDGQALLYPDGRVVNQEGYQVGTYANNQFTPQAGGMVAQPAPPQAAPPQPVIVKEPDGYSGWQIVGGIVVFILVILIVILILA